MIKTVKSLLTFEHMMLTENKNHMNNEIATSDQEDYSMYIVYLNIHGKSVP